MKAARFIAGSVLVVWRLPTIVATVVGWVAIEVQAHVRIHRAGRMFARAERLAEADRLDEAEALIEWGESLINSATPRRRGQG